MYGSKISNNLAEIPCLNLRVIEHFFLLPAAVKNNEAVAQFFYFYSRIYESVQNLELISS